MEPIAMLRVMICLPALRRISEGVKSWLQQDRAEMD